MFIFNETSSVVNSNNLVQIFRAIAIIAVVMIHTTPLGEWQVICRPFINFSVATFIFLSGYLTKLENKNWCNFMKKRINRVIAPYIIWSIIYSIPMIFDCGIWILLKNLITAKAGAQFYYIFVYIQFVLLTPFLAKLIKSKYQILGWFIAPFSIFIFKYLVLFIGEIDLNKYLSLLWSDSCLGWFTFYYLGLILGNRIININYSLRKLFVLYLFSLILQMLEGYVWFLLGEVNCGTQLKLTSLMTSVLFLLITDIILKRNYNIENKFIRLIGDYSFGIYLCHIFIIKLLSKIPYYNLIFYPINSVIVFLISFVCCYLGYKVCGEKIGKLFGFR